MSRAQMPSSGRPGRLMTRLALLVIGAGLSACGGSGGGDSGPTATPSTGSTPGTQPASSTSAGAPLVIYMDSFHGTVVAQTTDKSATYNLNLGLPEGQRVTDASCTRDGARAAYLVSMQSQKSSIRVYSRGEPQTLDFDLQAQSIAWSPDGSKIAINGFDLTQVSYKLIIVTLLSGERREVDLGKGSVGAMRWAPDSHRLVYDYSHQGVPQIFVADLDTQDAPRKITARTFGAFLPDWSPDGKTIMFSSPAPDGTPQLFSVSPEGSGETQLTTSAVLKTRPRWSPDGSQIAYIATVVVSQTAVLPLRLHNIGVWLAGADFSYERSFTDLALDAYLYDWCTPSEWLQQGWTLVSPP